MLFWPCAWAFALSPAPLNPHILLIFALGALLMRSAGCTYNDIVDRNIDAHVARTQHRPLVRGSVSITHAWGFLCLQLCAAASLLFFLPPLTIYLAFLSLILVATYPWMKRWTFWPQAFLGLTFGAWGVIMAWSATHAPFVLETGLCALAAFSWVLMYDTIYAHQDREDDLLIGVKSTAVLSAQSPRLFLSIWGSLMIICLGLLSKNWLYWVGLMGVAGCIGWQIATLDFKSSSNCQKRFMSNVYLGGYIAALLWLCKALHISSM